MLDHPIFVMLGFLLLWFFLVVVIPVSVWSFIKVFILRK